ncbi:MAG: hypothetical protein VXY34_02010 [Bdellovibrionota bacterium]|nr:hypothetical protein [Bdellovibrionota bacterium]
MTKKWEDLYSKTIEDLKNFKRPMIQLSSADFLEIRDLWKEGLQKLKDPSFKEEQKEQTLAFLEKIFCLLDHTQKPSVLFDSLYEESFKIIKKPELVIYLLSVSRKHLIEKKFLEGNPIPKSFIKSLENLLEDYENINPEVIEWTLRTIEQLGNQSLKLREAVLKIKPSWGSLFNQHKKASKQIIELLEKRWAPFKRR